MEDIEKTVLTVLVALSCPICIPMLLSEEDEGMKLTMSEKQKIAYEWAKKQKYNSVAADYARELAFLVDDLQARIEKMGKESREEVPHGKIDLV